VKRNLIIQCIIKNCFSSQCTVRVGQQLEFVAVYAYFNHASITTKKFTEKAILQKLFSAFLGLFYISVCY